MTARPTFVSLQRLLLGVAAAVLLSGCRADTRTVAGPPARFHNVGSWSGHGNAQTGTFKSDTGTFRFQWETKNETRPGAARLKVAFHSEDSGRPIMDAVDTTGVGHDVVYVGDLPRWYYLVIESADVDWFLSVDEDLGEPPVKDRP
jgi:hypothetical protein